MKYRIRTSKETEIILKELKSRTSLTPNILCRYAFSLSLNYDEKTSKDNMLLDYNTDNSGLEFQRQVLTGDLDIVFRELVISDLNKFISDDNYLTKHLKAHIERGVKLLKSEIEVHRSFDNFIIQHFNPKKGGSI